MWGGSRPRPSQQRRAIRFTHYFTSWTLSVPYSDPVYIKHSTLSVRRRLHIKRRTCHRGPDIWLFHGVKRQVWLYITLYKLWKMSPSNLLSYKINWVYKCIITMNRRSKAVKTCFVIITQIPNLNKILNCKSVYLNTQIPSTFFTCYFLLWADM